MNKNLKKIAAALTICTASALMPIADLDFTITKAYAASGDLTSIKLKASNGSTIKTYSDDDYKSSEKIDDGEFDDNGTYYAKTSSSKIEIDTKGVSSSYVRIFKGKGSSTKGVKPSKKIDISEDSTTTLTIRTYDEDPGTVKYSDDSYSSQYVIKVKCTESSSDSSDEDNNDDIYLKSISLSDGDIDFSKSTSNYNVNVDSSVNKIKITAKPDCDSSDYDEYEVRIDGSSVDEDDNFKKTVSLQKGQNEIKVTIQDNDENKRTYILNINRGNSNSNTSTSTNSNSNSTSNNSTNTTSVKVSQWVLVNGQWQYNDAQGNPVKNIWVNNYYIKSDGNMATGWQLIDNIWYYLGSDGAKKTGWQSISGNWYYLNAEGKMQTGWFKNSDGKYYYLYSNGKMAYSTIINGYKLDSNGAWNK